MDLWSNLTGEALSKAGKAGIAGGKDLALLLAVTATFFACFFGPSMATLKKMNVGRPALLPTCMTF